MKTATQLKKFRQQCERDAGVSAAHIKLPLLHVLNDLCQVHGISGKQRRRVIGGRGSHLLDDMQTWRVALKPTITHKTQNTPK